MSAADNYFDHTLFLLFISDMPRDIIKHIYAVDSIIYGDSSKTEDIRNFATDLTSDLALTAQRGKNWPVTLNISKKEASCYHHR